jgi:hypothetical protein
MKGINRINPITEAKFSPFIRESSIFFIVRIPQITQFRIKEPI